MPTRTILAIIPARGGSKGIPGKNMRPFAGKPLIVHSIGSALRAPSVDRVIVSTDSEEIARISKDAGAEIPFLRPASLAQDDSSIMDAVTDLIEKLRLQERYEPTHLLLLQPTSPLRTAEDIENAVRLLEKHQAESVVSLCRTENLLLSKDSRDRVAILNPEMALENSNRQVLPNYFKLDGSMIYLVQTSTFLRERSFLGGKLVGYEIERWRAVDLDEPQDWVVGELIFQNQETIMSRIRDMQ